MHEVLPNRARQLEAIAIHDHGARKYRFLAAHLTAPAYVPFAPQSNEKQMRTDTSSKRIARVAHARRHQVPFGSLQNSMPFRLAHIGHAGLPQVVAAAIQLKHKQFAKGASDDGEPTVGRLNDFLRSERQFLKNSDLVQKKLPLYLAVGIKPGYNLILYVPRKRISAVTRCDDVLGAHVPATACAAPELRPIGVEFDQKGVGRPVFNVSCVPATTKLPVGIYAKPIRRREAIGFRFHGPQHAPLGVQPGRETLAGS